MIRRLELAMKSSNVSSRRNLDGNVLERDQSDFSENFEGPHLTASIRKNYYTDLNKIDETRGNSTVEIGDLWVNEGNIELQTHTLHMVTGENVPQELLGFSFWAPFNSS